MHSNLLDMRNFQEQVKKAFCYQKLFWPFTVWINCFSYLKNFANKIPFLKRIFSVKSTHCEKAANHPTGLTKPLFLPSSVKTSGIFFSNFVAYSENLNFNNIGTLVWFRVRILSEKNTFLQLFLFLITTIEDIK